MEKKLPQEPPKLSQAMHQLRESAMETIIKKQTSRLIIEINISQGGVGKLFIDKRLLIK